MLPSFPYLIAVLWLALGMTGAAAQEVPIAPWSRLLIPSPGPARVEGFYSAGCLAGARALPLLGPGYEVMRPKRHRYYGHPELIRFLQRLGRKAAARGVRLLIGDMAQPRGGPTNSHHISHQTGLDVDIWFQVIDHRQRLSRRVANTLTAPSVVNIAAGRLRPSHWRRLFRDVLRWAAQSSETERIFVNPVIKRALCADPRNHAWLGKLRPWWGHADHFHVRLVCPADSPDCRPQPPPPVGSGCTPDLDNWVEAQKHPQPKSHAKPRPIILPAACQAVLDAP